MEGNTGYTERYREADLWTIPQIDLARPTCLEKRRNRDASAAASRGVAVSKARGIGLAHLLGIPPIVADPEDLVFTGKNL